MAYSILTPSFSADFQRCRLLAESIHRMVSGATHYVLVDPVDVEQFRPLEAFGSKVIDARELMGRHLWNLPHSRLWFTRFLHPMRGWITQQIRKIAFGQVGPEENILCVDSDVVFIRPFDPSDYTLGSRTPLFEIDHFNEESLGWANQARRLFGLPEQVTALGYVHPTFWRRSVLRTMTDELERLSGRPWEVLLGMQRTLSEYNLYGVFANEVLGKERAGVYSFNQPLMHLSWGRDLHGHEALIRFFEEADGPAAIVHSKDRVPVSSYAPIVRMMWQRADRLAPAMAANA